MGDKFSEAILEVVRCLAKDGKIEMIPGAIDVAVERLDGDRAGKRKYIRSKIPGILTNNYFKQFGDGFFDAFDRWSRVNAVWAEDVRAANTGAALRAAVRWVEVKVREEMEGKG